MQIRSSSMIIYTTKPDSSFLINEVNTFHELGKELLVLYEIDHPIPAQIQRKARFVLLPTLHRRELKAGLKFLLWHGVELLKVPFGDWMDAMRQGKFSDIFMRFINASQKLEFLQSEVELQEHRAVLSFWFYDVSLLMLMKSKGMIDRVYSRAHRGDLYEGETGVMPLLLRRYYLKHMDGLFPISRDGRAFLVDRYPAYENKIETIHLGSRRLFDPALKDRPVGDPLCIVSCSWINNKKRVHLIPEILASLKEPFHWYHFGSGSEEFEAALHAAIDQHELAPHCTLFGAKSNEEVQRFYAENRVDAFLSVSSTEGVPVSFMEAISYGIPIVATDVGGNREIVNETTGLLSDVNSSAESLAEKIPHVASRTNLDQRKKIIEYWEHHFNAEKLVKKISKMM